MDSATITNRTLKIDGMTGDACVQKVTGALKGVADVTTESVRVGSASIGADQKGTDAACAAITKAGFKAAEGPCTDNGSSQTCTQTLDEVKSGSQCCNAAQTPADIGAGAAKSSLGKGPATAL